jgi:peptidoglycan/LPS O-acetylase OafA/YrhL
VAAISAMSISLNPMRLMLLFLWFLFIASASFWLPAYNGDIGGEEPISVLIYALVAGLAAIGVRGRARSVREALLSALPTVALLGIAAVTGYLLNNQGPDYRGEPIYLYFGVALWVSWAVLVLSTALASRAKWDGFAGIGLGFLVSILGLFLFTAQID